MNDLITKQATDFLLFSKTVHKVKNISTHFEAGYPEIIKQKTASFCSETAFLLIPYLFFFL